MRRRARSGQSGVETMLLVTIVVTVLMGMVHLFQVTWAAQNSHIRAREAVLHDTHYLSLYSPRATRVTVSDTPSELTFGGDVNYEKAGVDGANQNIPVGVRGNYEFSATASDKTRDDSFGSQEVIVTASILN